MIFFGIDFGMAAGMLAIWVIGYVMGLLTTSIIRDLLKQKVVD